MSGYTPSYASVYSLFLPRSRSFAEEVGEITHRRVDTVGDIRGQIITPKDTEIKQLAVGEAKKTFRKYFRAIQFQLSHLQKQEGTDDVIAQVLEEHQKHLDEVFSMQESTDSGTTVLNNGLFYSKDANYTLKDSAEVDNANGYLPDLHKKMVALAEEANDVAGRKVMFVYGDSVRPLFDGVYDSSPVPFKRVLSEVLNDWSIAKLPKNIIPSGANGVIAVNMDKVMLNYTALPSLKKRGTNEEKSYDWFNFLSGSIMLDVEAKNAIIRQPFTLEAL